MHNQVELYRYKHTYIPYGAPPNTPEIKDAWWTTKWGVPFQLTDVASYPTGATLGGDNGVGQVAQCCGAASVFHTLPQNWVVYSKEKSDSYSPKTEIGNKGITVVGTHTDREVLGSIKRQYTLNDFKFEIYYSTVDIKDWFYDLPSIDHTNLTSDQQIYGMSAIPKMEKPIAINKNKPILSVYHNGILVVHPRALNLILDTGSPVILIGAIDNISHRGIPNLIADGFNKYLVDRVDNIYNMNYLARRLSCYILYKGN